MIEGPTESSLLPLFQKFFNNLFQHGKQKQHRTLGNVIILIFIHFFSQYSRENTGVYIVHYL